MLVRFFLHQEPSDNWTEFEQQARMATWMEQRYYDQLSIHIANNLGKVLK